MHPSPAIIQQRGVQFFEEGKFKEAIQEWDKVIELNPRMEAQHWQRGIAYYYAGEYQKGVDQFELHQTVNSQDVENAVWHFICKARVDGLEAARASLIPIHADSRVPMDQIWNLFAGMGTVDDVLDAASPPSPYQHQRLCYAHLYLGLYFEALNNTEEAKKHIKLAATDYAMDNYMGMVAQVHWRVLQHKDKS
ncbi:MAG: tetratricopeptide repeat protein [Verrucomicrobiae bacterium]|nr:tetratricopeptide repeat protein [Verrucomicrobiae bacterium]